MAIKPISDLVLERDAVISARREALARWVQGAQPQKKTIYYEFVQPLTDRLRLLNRALGV